MKYKDRVNISGFYEGTGSVILVEEKEYAGISFGKKFLIELDVDGSRVWIDENKIQLVK